jgi:RNA-directed DNA polymerase
MSRKPKKRMPGTLIELVFHKKSQSTIQDLALRLNPKIRGWINYYGKVRKKSLTPVFYHLHHRFIKWILNKYKGFKWSKIKAVNWLRRIIVSFPYLFYHWQLGYKFVRI